MPPVPGAHDRCDLVQESRGVLRVSGGGRQAVDEPGEVVVEAAQEQLADVLGEDTGKGDREVASIGLRLEGDAEVSFPVADHVLGARRALVFGAHGLEREEGCEENDSRYMCFFEDFQYELDVIRIRLGLPTVSSWSERDDEDPPEEETEPTADHLQQMREALKHPSNDWTASRALRGLMRHDPETVMEFLMEHRPVELGLRYSIGSWCARTLMESDPNALRRLLGAEEPTYRVAAAIYLTFLDDKEGRAELRKLSSLEGEPGDWASLALLRRGESSAIARALSVFRHPTNSRTEARVLANRLLVLLSNSARHSGLELPQSLEWLKDETVEERANRRYAHYHGWWAKNRAQLTLHDPWFQEFARQRVD